MAPSRPARSPTAWASARARLPCGSSASAPACGESSARSCSALPERRARSAARIYAQDLFADEEQIAERDRGAFPDAREGAVRGSEVLDGNGLAGNGDVRVLARDVPVVRKGD